MRLKIAFAVLVFLLISEALAGFWLAGRWFISSRHASLTLGTVKNWLNRGIINSSTQTVKLFIQRNGKWFLLTLALSEVIPEVQQRLQASQYCYQITNYTTYIAIASSYTPRISMNADYPPNNQYFTYTFSCTGDLTNEGSNPYPVKQYNIYRVLPSGSIGGYVAYIPEPGTYTLTTRDGKRTCTVNIRMANDYPMCGSSSSSWENERRRVPVPRVIPRVEDFVRPEVIAQDPALSWLRDEYQRIANDNSIPTIPSDALSDVDLPQVDWSIPPEEAIDLEGSRSGSQEGQNQEEGDISVPGLDTKLDPVQRKPFPLELIDQAVQNHPLLRVLGSVNLDFGSGGSCQVGSGVFTIEFCSYAWVLNLMGSIIVPIAFLIGLFGWRND
jgi:hypothetical protein